jgi:hypothetical protein
MSIIRKLVIVPTSVIFAITMFVEICMAAHVIWSLFISKEDIYSVSDLLWLVAIFTFSIILFIAVQSFSKLVDSVMSNSSER